MSQSNENDKAKDAVYSSYVDRVLPKSVFERIQNETNRRMVRKFNNNQVMNPLEWAAFWTIIIIMIINPRRSIP